MDLDLSSAHLQTFPNLAGRRYKKITAASNNIQVLWEELMPNEVIELSLEDNRISTDGLLTEWPQMIQTLSLARNPFRDIDIIMRWPAALKTLDLSHTNLTEFPRNLPETLEALNISNTYIRSVQRLPAGLKEFYATNTDLKFLPGRLPDGLEILTTPFAKLRNGGLPHRWGERLRILDLAGNYISQFPRHLPNSLEMLNLSLNEIREVPARELEIPASLQTLHLGRNRIRKVQSWMLTRRNLVFTIQQNCLVEPITSPNCLLWEGQWVGGIYSVAAVLIQKNWRITRLRQRLKAWRRTAHLREELLALAMCPDRAGCFEDISPSWSFEWKDPFS